MDVSAAIFFDAEDDEFGGYYGPPIKEAFFSELLMSGRADASCFRLYSGDLLVGELTRRIAEVKFGGPPKGMKSGARYWPSSTTWVDDRPARAALAADLTSALSDGWHVWTGNDTSFYLATPRTYVLYVEPLDRRVVASIAEALAGRRWFIGAAAIDLGNPLQVALMPGFLVYHGYYRDRCLWFVQPGGDDPDERWDVSGAIRVKGLKCLWHDAALDQQEPLPLPRPAQSERGAVSGVLLAAVSAPTHHERVLNALAAARFHDHDRLVVLGVNKLSAVDHAVVPREKLAEYALSTTHPTGMHKARLFDHVLGIRADDWQYLAEQLRAGLHEVQVTQVRDASAWGTEHHIQYRADMPIVGRNGAIEVVRTVWKIVDSGPPTLVTLFLQGERND